MDQSVQLPTRRRVVLAFLIAPFVAALAMAAIEPLYAGLPSMAQRISETLVWYLLIGAYPTTLIFGVPLFFLLRKRVKPNAVTCTLVGGVVAALPWAILAIVPPSAGSGAIDDGQVTILNGHRTIAGWLYAAQSVAEVGAYGLLAGLVFWAVATQFRSSVRSV